MTRKTSWWLALGLAAFVGCENAPSEDTATNPPPPPASTPGNQPGAKSEGGAGGGTGSIGVPTNAGQAPANYPADYPGMKKAESKDANAEAKPEAEAPKADEPKADEPKAAQVQLSEEEIANIKKLPEADQKIALEQKLCPVSGEHLGMDVPVKVTVEGTTFFLCCDNCKDKVDKDPKGVLADLNKLKK
jgi:YHS domain-containing protein